MGLKTKNSLQLWTGQNHTLKDDFEFQAQSLPYLNPTKQTIDSIIQLLTV